MNLCVVLLLVFVGAYVAKVLTLGKESIWEWTTAARTILWTHETLIAVMLVSGAAARWMARRLPGDKGEDLRRRHRLSGRTAIVAGVLGLLSAFVVLVNMYRLAAG